MAHKVYTIEKISDVFQIPEDRFEAFLEEFRTFYQVGKPMITLVEELADEVAKTQVKSAVKRMRWVDDGKRDVRIHLETTQENKDQ